MIIFISFYIFMTVFSIKGIVTRRFSQLSEGLVKSSSVIVLHNLIFMAARVFHAMNFALNDVIPALGQALIYLLLSTAIGMTLMLFTG